MSSSSTTNSSSNAATASASPSSVPLIPVRKDLDAHDKNARHQMQPIQILLEGAAQRTILTNLDAIATKLNRPSLLLLKYISNSIGCTGFAQHGKYILQSRPPIAMVQSVIYDFIGRFVLCPRCSDVGTYFFIKSKNKKNHELKIHCVACGKQTSMATVVSGAGSSKPDLSACNSIATMIADNSAGSMLYDPANPPVAVAASSFSSASASANNNNGNNKDEPATTTTESTSSKENVDPDNEQTWNRLMKKDSSDEIIVTPVEKLHQTLQKEAASGSASRIESTIELLRMKSTLNLTDDEVVQLCFRAVVFNPKFFESNDKQQNNDEMFESLVASITIHAAFLRSFGVTVRKAPTIRQKLRFILELVRHCKICGFSPDRVAMGLSLFHKETICDEGELVLWAQECLVKNQHQDDEEFSDGVLKECEKIFKWKAGDGDDKNDV